MTLFIDDKGNFCFTVNPIETRDKAEKAEEKFNNAYAELMYLKGKRDGQSRDKTESEE